MLLDIVGGEAGPLIDSTVKKQMPKIQDIKFSLERAEQLLGIAIKASDAKAIFEGLGMDVDEGKTWQVKVPSYRFDISQEEDLIEELARLIGYDKLPAELPDLSYEPPRYSERQLSKHRIATALQGRGYHEVMTYSFVDQATLSLFDEEVPVVLSNPVSQEMAVMRTSLWPSLAKTLQYNLNRQLSRLRIFEVGSVFTSKKEHKHLAGLVFGPVFPEQWSEKSRLSDFFDVKSDLEAIFNLSFESESFEFKKEDHRALHPGRSAGIYRAGQLRGYLGELHPHIAATLSLPAGVFLFEMDLETLEKCQLPQFEKLSKFPSIRRDLAFIVNRELEISALLATIRKLTGPIFRDLWVFDVYEGKGVQDGQKSVALGLILQDSSRTLKEKDVNECVDRVIQAVQDEHRATLRN